MPLPSWDHGVVNNLRREYGEKIKKYSDEQLHDGWKDFSQCEDYPDKDGNAFPGYMSVLCD